VILALYFKICGVFSAGLQHFVKLKGKIIKFLLGNRNCKQMHLSLSYIIRKHQNLELDF